MHYIEQLNDMQKKAVLHVGSPLLILAGAGSGKTRVITTKIAYLIETGYVKPYEILAVTFTKKACKEMKDRAIALNPMAEDVVIKTFHAFCSKILRRFASEIGLKNEFSIIDDADSLSLLKSIFPTFKEYDLKNYRKLISLAKDYYLFPGDNLKSISSDPYFQKVYETYQKKIASLDCIDFGDLICLVAKLVKENDKVRDFITNRYKVILIDEYQDSNVAQYELVKNMTTSSTYLCVVGDDDQSIYKFRGAEIKNILNFPVYFKNTEIIKLEQNYRSTQKILDIASTVISKNSDRLGKNLWTDNSEAGIFEIKEFENYEDEATFAAKILQDKNYNSTAILYRTNAQSVVFETVFSKFNIPYRIIGSLKFYDREEIKDTLAYLSLLTNQKNELAFKRIVNKPPRKIGSVTINKIIEDAPNFNYNILDSAENFAEKNKKIELTNFINLHRKIVASLQDLSLAATIQLFLSESGLLDYYKKEDAVNDTNKCDNLNEFINIASNYPKGKDGLISFLEDIELDTSLGNNENNGEGVSLITMHNTKGLEFDRVIITGLEDGIFPSKSSNKPSDIEEERRIFYVAITRARKDLYITYAKKRRFWGKLQYLEPSQFIYDLPKIYIPKQVTNCKYPIGTWVYHDDYGRGKIVKQWFSGDNDMVIIAFESGFQGQFLTKYTNLEIISKKFI